MNSPHLLALPPDALPHQGFTAFRVVQSGVFQNRTYVAGEVLLCRGTPRSGDSVVLVARWGRPRLGRVQGTALLGDLGERCHPERWAPAGRVVAVLRPGCAAPEPIEAAGPAGPQGDQRPPRPVAPARQLIPRPQRRAPHPQLSLFAA